jgi:hypothetical protein
MSYCRWSSDNFRCELYCYEDVRGGFTTHVAGNKVLGDIPEEDWAGFIAKRISAEEFAKQHKAQMDYLDSAERAPIGLPYDGKSFNDPDLESFLARLLHLREVGYKFPDYVLDSVRGEIEMEKTVAASTSVKK